MCPSHCEFLAALEVLEDELGTSDRQWLRNITTRVLEAAEWQRAHNPMWEPKLCVRADE